MATEEELINMIDSQLNVYDYKTIAWKLLMDNVDNTQLQIEFNNEDDGYENNNSCTDHFELLLNIFMEMFVGLILVMEQDESGHKNIKFNNLCFESYFKTIHEKFININILSCIETINVNNDNMDYIDEILNNRYCRIILKKDPKYRKIFKKNHFDNDYHMFLCDNDNNYTKLKSVYGVLYTTNKVYKICFDTINVSNNELQEKRNDMYI